MNATMKYEGTYHKSYHSDYRTNSRRRKQNVFSSKRMLFIAITVVAILLGVVIGNNVINSSHSSAYTTVEKELCYTSIKIQSGDTLWTIAEEYMCPEYDDINAYIKDVKQINNLHSDTIHAGRYLMVPYYEVIK